MKIYIGIVSANIGYGSKSVIIYAGVNIRTARRLTELKIKDVETDWEVDAIGEIQVWKNGKIINSIKINLEQ